MTAFRDLWQEQRRLRQAEVVSRKQQVRDILTSFEQERQVMASQLRDDLSLFQLELQQETHTFLTNVSQQRQTQAEQLTQLLRNFVEILQSQTAEFLAASAADRSLMAQQLTQDLSRFHAHLISSVAALRQVLQARMQDLQADVQMLQAETQEMLIANREQRLQAKAQMAQELATFVEGLRVDVQNYLSELELVREDRAQQLKQMLKLSREQRITEVDAMFQELSEFRTELRDYCINLRSQVWGGEGAPEAKVATPQMTQPQPQPRVAPTVVTPTKPAPSAVQPQAQSTAPSLQPPSQPAPVPQPVAPVVSVPAAPPADPQPVAVDPEPVVVLPAANTSELVAEASVVAQPDVLTVVMNPTPKPVQVDSAELEKEIYNHVHQVKGARLTEIETALGINRFQAVDALRALIKKGLITQRDRIYLIQEEVSL